MKNKLKLATNQIIKYLFTIKEHTMETMDSEIKLILANKLYEDIKNIFFIKSDLSIDMSILDSKDELIKIINDFNKMGGFSFTSTEYMKILDILKDIDMTQIEDIDYTYICELVDTLLNDEINAQLALIMNAVKGLRQDLYQNDFCTGSEAYRETIRMLFMKMVEDKKIKNGEIKNLKFYIFTINTFKDNFEHWKKLSGNETKTETDFLNEKFKKEVLNLDGSRSPEIAIYSKLFRANEEIVSNRQMIAKYIAKLENVNIVDLMDYGKDVLGVVYEQFIGEVQNSGAGQIFTPTDVVEFAIDIAQLTKDDVCLDFCSGSGRFMTSAMRKMIVDAKKNIHDKKDLEEKIEHIKHNQVYGADLGADPTLNTKRNMALAGDGSSHIANMNSLLISSKKVGDDVISTFTNGAGVNKKELVGVDGEQFDITNCSFILTNPPFGDLTLDDKYDDVWIDEMRETFNKACKSELKRWKPMFDNLIEETVKSECNLEYIIDAFDDLLDKAPLDRNSKVEKHFDKLKESFEKKDNKALNKWIDKIFEDGVRTVTTQWKKDKNNNRKLDGRKDFKGCLLFLYKAYQILKVGGHALIVVDDGVLNTDTYAFARDFIRNKFNIKAVFSLSDRAFYAHSDKMIKTSILYLEKKVEALDEDGDIFTVKQTDPVFYAHIEKTGQNSKRGKYETHFNEVKDGYFDFVKKVEENKKTNCGVFHKKSFVFDEVIITPQTSNDIDDSEDDYNEE